MTSNYKISTEKVYELICEENEHNPIVGTAFYETKQFVMGLGYSKGGSTVVLQRLERQYDIHLYRRPHDHRHTETGEVLNREFGVTKSSDERLYSRLLNFYRKRLAKGMTKEQAIKATHEYYDPILGKDCVKEPQTVDVAMVVPNTLSAAGRYKDLSDLDIEI